jgi:hypothetical protein
MLLIETHLSSPVRVATVCNFIVLSRNERSNPPIVVHQWRCGQMEVTPRPKHLSTAIAIGLAGVGLLVFLSFIR